MIQLRDLKDSDVGRWVVYRDPFDGRTDLGRVKSWNQKFIFVVYRCAGNWDDFANYTGVATAPGDLEFKE